MSDFEYNTGYFYPLNEEEYKYLNDVDFFGNDIVQPPFYFETFGHNHYLVLGQTHSYGIENHEFGHSRQLTDNEKNLVPPKFEQEFTNLNFDKTKFKFVEYCWYNSVDCKDYYLENNESKPMTLDEAIAHAKEIAASKCDECGKEHAQLAEWLQELADYEDETPITDEFLNRNFTYSALSNSWDYNQISVTKAKEIDGLYYVNMLFGAAIEIKTIGQLRMFLTILGLSDFVKQLKS